MKKLYGVLIVFVLLGLSFFWWDKPRPSAKPESTENTFVVVGSANPGEIVLYKAENDTLTEQKRVDTGYKFVYTVRAGDIFNTGDTSFVAGVGDSFFKDPYGCHVVSYSLDFEKKETIDTLSDLRCKDITIDDIDQDGTNEVILATHGEGYINLYRYSDGQWQKEEIEHNFISQIDQQENMNHRVPEESLPCNNCIVQSAVHIVKTVDTDGVGEKEIIATISSPLELQKIDEISFVMLYKKKNGIWEKQIIDRAENLEFRSIEFGDIDQNGRQDIVVGTGSPREVPSSVVAYEYADSVWNKKEIFTDSQSKNMKGLAVTDYGQKGKDSIILATGFPDSTLYHIMWNGGEFITKELGAASVIIRNGGQHNAMSALVLPGTQTVITAGMSTFPEKKIGWEASDQGFLIYYTSKNGTLSSRLVDDANILGMDLFTQ